MPCSFHRIRSRACAQARDGQPAHRRHGPYGPCLQQVIGRHPLHVKRQCWRLRICRLHEVSDNMRYAPRFAAPRPPALARDALIACLRPVVARAAAIRAPRYLASNAEAGTGDCAPPAPSPCGVAMAGQLGREGAGRRARRPVFRNHRDTDFREIRLC